VTTSVPKSAEAQKSWAEGYNCGLELAAQQLERANKQTELIFLVNAIRGMMLPDGPSSAEIKATLGMPERTAK
jgi:hypothetical protein